MNRQRRFGGPIGTIQVAVTGLRTMLREPSARIHLLVTILILVTAIAVGFDRLDWLWIIVALTLVWISEAMNTAIERLGDSISLEHRREIGIAKDVAAAAVMLCLVGATIICTIVFWPFLARLAGL